MADGKRIRIARRFPYRAGARLLLRLVAPVLALCLGGCSLVGLGVGSVVNATRSKDLLHLTPESAAFLQTGSAVTLVMTDSSTVTGVVLDPQFPGGVDSRRSAVRLAHLRSEHPARLDTLFVPLEQVAYARAPRARHAARTGFRAGLMADLAVLGVVFITALLVLFILLMISSSGYGFG